MAVVNFTNRIIRGAKKHTLDIDNSMVVNLTKGKSVKAVAATVVKQIENASKREDMIVLGLPLWLTVEVEFLLAKHKLATQVFYCLEGTLVPSPLFEKYDSLFAEKPIMENLALELEA